ncbi:MAG: hypothetical protein L3J02_07145, partial [Henriciella sp.]|nr:hypothetical protein [Henriciella sp.]
HGEDKKPMAAYLQRLDKVKGRFEDSRLLYVAATRAKQRLHLLGHVGFQKQDGGYELNDPPKDSLLARLWPVLENNFQSLLAERSAETPLLEDAAEPAVHATVRTRLALDCAGCRWCLCSWRTGILSKFGSDECDPGKTGRG